MLTMMIFVMRSLSNEGFSVAGHRSSRSQTSELASLLLLFPHACSHRPHP